MTDLCFCKKCLVMSTRPRVTFNAEGICNACQWHEEKKKIDWDAREILLQELLDKHRKHDGSFDCVVPVSGGKDGSYVSHRLKNDYGMNPLCITVTPALEMDLGRENLRSFIESGFDHISININPSILRKANKWGFINKGFPYYGWLTAIASAPLNFASKFNINLVFYGEDGEVEYGGSTKTKHTPIYDIDYIREVYLEGGYTDLLKMPSVNPQDLNLFKFPDLNDSKNLKIAHWSFFENWDPYRNYLVAKENCGLKEAETTNNGTFTNFAQNDQGLYALHTYLMYLKFGFGRANQDASIDIRRGAMSREQGVNLVRMFDGAYPEDLMDEYCSYYNMSEAEIVGVFDKYANRKLFEKRDGRWVPLFQVV